MARPRVVQNTGKGMVYKRGRPSHKLQSIDKNDLPISRLVDQLQVWQTPFSLASVTLESGAYNDHKISLELLNYNSSVGCATLVQACVRSISKSRIAKTPVLIEHTLHALIQPC